MILRLALQLSSSMDRQNFSSPGASNFSLALNIVRDCEEKCLLVTFGHITENGLTSHFAKD